MASTTGFALVVAAIALLGSSAAQAHHSGAVFDLGTIVELRGVVVDFKLRSPHASFVIDGRVFENGEPQGSVARWEVEWESAPMLKTLGVEPETFAPGDEVTITATPHRDRTFRFVHALSVDDAFGDVYVMANSDRLFSPSLQRAAAAVGSDTVADASGGGAVPPAREIAGRWQQPLIEFSVGVPSLPLNDVGMAAWRNYDRKQSPANACEPINVPDVYSAPFFLFDLRVDAGQAVLRHEAYDTVRTVPLSGAAAGAEPSGRFGIVSGRIENGTLIVDSRDYPASAWGLGIEEMHGGGVIPSSDRKTLTERFSVTPDGRTLVYAYTLYDPVYMTEPYTGRVELTRVPDDVEMHAYECDVESAAMWSRQAADAPLSIGPASGSE
jgi:hypothetical protein